MKCDNCKWNFTCHDNDKNCKEFEPDIDTGTYIHNNKEQFIKEYSVYELQYDEESFP